MNLKKQSQFTGVIKWLENSSGKGTLSDCTVSVLRTMCYVLSRGTLNFEL